jgi:hypothetical protein
MPPLAGVPCFGLPLPYLRHVNSWVYEPIAKVRRPGRCKKCRFTDACGKVVARRVAWEPTLKQRADEYVIARNKLSDITVRIQKVKANGRFKPELRDQYAKAISRERAENTRFRYELLSCGNWISVNDRPIVADNLAAEKAKMAAARKARQRQLRAGDVSTEYLDALGRAERHRAEQLVDYAQQPGADRDIRKVGADGLRRDARVWAVAMRLGWENIKATPYAIARRLGATTSEEVNRQRDWVRRSLRRITRYECEVMTGLSRPLWPKFKPEDWIEQPAEPLGVGQLHTLRTL